MKITKDDFYVGQELLLQQSNKRMGELIKANVHSIGRQYVYLGYDNKGYRIDLELNKRIYGIKNYGYRGRFFFSEKDYEEHIEAQQLKRYISDNIYITDYIPIDLLRDMAEHLKREEEIESVEC